METMPIKYICVHLRNRFNNSIKLKWDKDQKIYCRNVHCLIQSVTFLPSLHTWLSHKALQDTEKHTPSDPAPGIMPCLRGPRPALSSSICPPGFLFYCLIREKKNQTAQASEVLFRVCYPVLSISILRAP